MIGDSMVRVFTNDFFENADTKYIKGTTISTIQDALNTMGVSVYDHIVVHSGKNEYTCQFRWRRSSIIFEEIVTLTQVSSAGSKIAITGPYPGWTSIAIE